MNWESRGFHPDKQVYARHPFVYLVEAADDICYRVIDFEDAHRLHIISIEMVRELFLSFFDQEEGYDARDRVERSFPGSMMTIRKSSSCVPS